MSEEEHKKYYHEQEIRSILTAQTIAKNKYGRIYSSGRVYFYYGAYAWRRI